MENRSRLHNLCIDEIPKYKQESWEDTEELLTDTLREQLGVNKIQIERAHLVRIKEAGKDRTIDAKFCSGKGKQNVLNEARCQKKEDIY